MESGGGGCLAIISSCAGDITGIGYDSCKNDERRYKNDATRTTFVCAGEGRPTSNGVGGELTQAVAGE